MNNPQTQRRRNRSAWKISGESQAQISARSPRKDYFMNAEHFRKEHKNNSASRIFETSFDHRKNERYLRQGDQILASPQKQPVMYTPISKLTQIQLEKSPTMVKKDDEGERVVEKYKEKINKEKQRILNRLKVEVSNLGALQVEIAAIKQAVVEKSADRNKELKILKEKIISRMQAFLLSALPSNKTQSHQVQVQSVLTKPEIQDKVADSTQHQKSIPMISTDTQTDFEQNQEPQTKVITIRQFLKASTDSFKSIDSAKWSQKAPTNKKFQLCKVIEEVYVSSHKVVCKSTEKKEDKTHTNLRKTLKIYHSFNEIINAFTLAPQIKPTFEKTALSPQESKTSQLMTTTPTFVQNTSQLKPDSFAEISEIKSSTKPQISIVKHSVSPQPRLTPMRQHSSSIDVERCRQRLLQVSKSNDKLFSKQRRSTLVVVNEKQQTLKKQMNLSRFYEAIDRLKQEVSSIKELSHISEHKAHSSIH